MLSPARVLRARHSPLTRLGCHVRWLTGKVTSGDKRPQLESVGDRPPPPYFPLSYSLPTHVCTQNPSHKNKSKCIHPSLLEKSAHCIYTDSLQRSHIQLIFSILQQHDILTGKRLSRRMEQGEDGERHAESGIPPSDHYERHVKRGRETEALTWAGPHREGEAERQGSRGIDRKKPREESVRQGGRGRIVKNHRQENNKRRERERKERMA